MKKRLVLFAALLTALTMFFSCAGAEKAAVNVAFLKGPTGMGAAKLMADADAGTTQNAYSFTLVGAADVVTGQLVSGELDMALLTPRDAENFEDVEGYSVYRMKTSDYRGILFNFWNEYWTENKDIIPAICYGIDRQAIVDAVILGHGIVAYGPLQRNEYNNENVEH